MQQGRNVYSTPQKTLPHTFKKYAGFVFHSFLQQWFFAHKGHYPVLGLHGNKINIFLKYLVKDRRAMN
jgi:hypothetical protein